MTFIEALKNDIQHSNRLLDAANKLADHGSACLSDFVSEMGGSAYYVEHPRNYRGSDLIYHPSLQHGPQFWGDKSWYVLRMWPYDPDPGTVKVKWWSLDQEEQYTLVRTCGGNLAIECKLREIITEFITRRKYQLS